MVYKSDYVCHNSLMNELRISRPVLYKVATTTYIFRLQFLVQWTSRFVFVRHKFADHRATGLAAYSQVINQTHQARRLITVTSIITSYLFYPVLVTQQSFSVHLKQIASFLRMKTFFVRERSFRNSFCTNKIMSETERSKVTSLDRRHYVSPHYGKSFNFQPSYVSNTH